VVVRVGAAAEGVAITAGRVAVGVRDPAQLVVVGERSGRVERRVGLPGAPRHLATAGARVLVPAEDADSLAVVDVRSGRVIARSAVGRRPHDAAAGAGGTVYVGDEAGNALTVLWPGRPPRRVPVFTQPGGVTTLDGGREIAVVSVRERRLELRSAQSLRRLASTPVGVGPTHVACLDQGPCFVADTQGQALLVVALHPLRVARRVYLPGGPYGIALDQAHRRLWVTLPARNLLAELPAHGRPHVLAEYPTVRQPDTVAVDPGTGVVAVTGRSGGLLQLLRPRAAARR
jgi:DNA-binding beta-propeller fold protein YncE